MTGTWGQFTDREAINSNQLGTASPARSTATVNSVNIGIGATGDDEDNCVLMSRHHGPCSARTPGHCQARTGCAVTNLRDIPHVLETFNT